MQIFDKTIKVNIRQKARGIRHKLRSLIIFAFCLITFALKASDPVTVIVSLSPPYTPFLNEYGSNGVDKLQVSLLVNDSRMVNYPAKLQMLIEHVGSGIVMRTSEYAAIAPIMLTGNVTEVFNGFDLNKYFLAQNNVFTGFDQSQYMQTGRVPDGQYRIGFRVVDSRRTDVVLSNTAYTQPGWFVLNDPPQINLPRNKEKVRVNDLQNVKLEWFPRHLGSLNAAFATSYQIELFAIRVPGMNPNQVAMSMQPDFTDVTNRTSYYLTNDKYLLEPGVEYAYRIKAMAGDDQLTLFQNDGYSEVFSFIYGSLCPETENVSAQTLGIDKVEISWDTDPLQTSFETRFRKASQVNDVWHTRESFIGMAEISNVLSPGVKYEYQVKATCTTVESDYSTLDYFTMPYPPNAKFECGADDSVLVSNTIPKASLQEGEMIFYGQFPIKLTEVSGSNGVFTGKGRMRIPFLANIQVNMQFNGIKVNELNEVYEGELVSIYNPDSKFLIDDVSDYFAEGDQIGNIIDGVDSAAITLGFPVDNASNLTVIVSGNSVTVSSGGQSVSTTIENSEEGTTIQDSDGNLYAVDENGNVSQVGKTTPDGETQSTSSGNFSPGNLDSEIQISFENAGKWAFDAFDDVYAGSKFADEFETVDGRITPWKFVPIGKSDKVSARLTKGSIDLSKIKFKTPTGTEFFTEEKGGKLEITLIGAKQRDGYELFAVYEENDSTTRTIGKVNIASYPLLERHLTIVPMQSGSISASSIEAAINAIYKPYGISWSVNIDDIFDDRSWDTDNNGLKGTGTEFYSAFTDEMRALNANYTAQRGVDDKSVYLFWFAENAEGAENMLGDMPLDSRFGYVFSPTITDKTHQTIAHELAHGVFQLRHTFSSKYGIEKNTTKNLMDYAGGTELTKYQWDLIHDPQTMLFAWAQDEEEGASIETFYSFIKQKITEISAKNPTALLGVIHCEECDVPVNPENIKSGVIELTNNASGTFYYDSKRRCLALFYHPGDGTKILFGEDGLKNLKGLSLLNENQKQLTVILDGDITLDCDEYITTSLSNYFKCTDKEEELGEEYITELFVQVDECIKAHIEQINKELNDGDISIPLTNAIDIKAVEEDLTSKLSENTFAGVKFSVQLSDDNGYSQNLFSPGVGSVEESEVRLKFHVSNSQKQLIASIDVSDSYLEEFEGKVSQRAVDRGVDVNVSELRQEIIKDIKSGFELMTKHLNQQGYDVPTVAEKAEEGFKESFTQNQEFLQQYLSELEQSSSDYFASLKTTNIPDIEIDESQIPEIDLDDIDLSEEQTTSTKSENLYAGEILRFWQVAQVNVKHIWDEGTMHSGTWHSNDPKSEAKKFPAYANFGAMPVGACDAIIDEIMGIPLIVRTGYQIMTDKQQREGFKQMFTKEGFNSLKTSLKDEIDQTLSDDQLFAYRGTKTATTVAFAFVTGGGNLLVKGGQKLDEIFGVLEGLGKMLDGCPKLAGYVNTLKNAGKAAQGKIGEVSKLAGEYGSKQLDNILSQVTDLDGAIKNLTELLGKFSKEALEKSLKFVGPDEIEAVLSKLNKISNVIGVDKLMADMGEFWTKYIGSSFVLDYLSKIDDDVLKQLVANGRVEIESITKILNASGDVVTRVYDVIIDGVYYEFKSWKGWPSWADGVIQKQLVRDLINPEVTSLDKLKWVFKKTDGITDDVLKDKVIGALKKDIPKLKEGLNFNTVKKLFPADELIDETNYAERLIKNIEKAENFNKVFKVVE